MKFLLMLVVAAVFLTLSGRRSARRAARAAPPQRRVEALLACRRCGVHTPSSQCTWSEGQPYCCADHAGRG